MAAEEKKCGDEEALEIEVRCPTVPRVLALLRGLAKGLADEAGFDQAEIAEIEMAVDEACANVINHAYKHLSEDDRIALIRNWSADTPPPVNPKRAMIKLQVFVSEEMIRFKVIDYGVGIDNMPKGVDSVDEYLDKGAKGGLGTYIIKNFMDEVTYECPRDRGTVLTMTRYRRQD